MRKPKNPWRVRDCENMSLNGDSNINWGYAVMRWNYGAQDFVDKAWFPIKQAAEDYVRLMREIGD